MRDIESLMKGYSLVTLLIPEPTGCTTFVPRPLRNPLVLSLMITPKEKDVVEDEYDVSPQQTDV